MAYKKTQPEIIIESLQSNDYYVREAYNSLRTNLKFSGTDIKTIFITSCQPNEGKSSVSFELARTLAEDGKNTVFVDMDLRKSVVIGSKQIRTKNNAEFKGASHYLSGQASYEDIVYKTNIENLSMIIAGPEPPNPTGLIDSALFESMIDRLKETYDMIIIDTPPLGTVIDAALIAPYCDGAILLIQSNAISYRFAQGVKQQIEKTGCRLLGAVLNKVEPLKAGHYKTYGYSKYGYYNHYSSL